MNFLVFVPVADDQVVGVFGEPENGLQFGLLAALEPDAVDGAELHDFFHDVTLLIHFDRIHRSCNRRCTRTLRAPRADAR